MDAILSAAATLAAAWLTRVVERRKWRRGGDPVTAGSIRANWNPEWGADPGVPS